MHVGLSYLAVYRRSKKDEKMNGLSRMYKSGTDSPFLKQYGNNAG
jgi:hypothetical protein